MRTAFIICLFSFFGFYTATAQGGGATLRGKVEEQGTRDLLPGVNVFIEGTVIGTSTNIDGLYEIKNVPPGTHKVICSFIGYTTSTAEITVSAGQILTQDFTIAEAMAELGEVNIVARRNTSTDNAVLMEIKEAKQMVSGISRQQIATSQDSDAAKAMQRVPGVTIVENRFVMIRGVAERYNQVMINNVIAPSTEVDRRTFSFDLIQSDALDRMVINKTGSPEYPGDFCGGIIRLYTVNEVESDFTNVRLGLGYRVGTTFNDFFMSEGSSTDFLGFDGGFRRLPDGFPSTRSLQGSPRNSEIRQDAGRSLPNNWQPQRGMALPNYSFGISLGRNKDLGEGRRLINTTNISYNKEFQYRAREFNRFDAWEDQTQPIDQWFAYDDDMYDEETTISAMSNWNYIFNSRHQLKFSNLLSQIGEEQTVIRRGTNFFRPTDEFRNYLLGYRSRTIYSGQLEGIHEFDPKNSFRWVTGFGLLTEQQPDLRRFRTFRPAAEGDDAEANPFQMLLPPSSNLFDTGRFFGDLTERSFNNGMDYTHVIRETAEGKTEINAGTYIDYRSRDFDSRYFSFLYPGATNDPAIGDSLARLPLDEIFSEQNIRTANGFVLEEGTRPIDAYFASNFLTSAYVSATVPLGKLTLSGGVRAEYNIQRLEAEDDFEVITVNNPLLSLLPSVNAGYTLSPKSLIRGGYSRTVNRPEFRELAPFLFYDYILDAGKAGNPNLVTATIDNLDLRWEWYPRLGETVSLGAFYKRFTNPIENILIITTEQPQFTFANADFAKNYGAELEVRKSLKGVLDNKILERFSLVLNASYIFSEVDLGERASAQDRVRALQGQSPYIINLGAVYRDNATATTVSLFFNRFGDRIFTVGDVIFPTIYELSRNSLDLTLTKDFGKRLSVKAGVRDLLNAPFRFVQDSDRDGKITDRDHTIFAFQRGQLISLSATFKLH